MVSCANLKCDVIFVVRPDSECFLSMHARDHHVYARVCCASASLTEPLCSGNNAQGSQARWSNAVTAASSMARTRMDRCLSILEQCPSFIKHQQKRRVPAMLHQSNRRSPQSIKVRLPRKMFRFDQREPVFTHIVTCACHYLRNTPGPAAGQSSLWPAAGRSTLRGNLCKLYVHEFE